MPVVVQQQVPMVVTAQKPVVIPQVRFLDKVVHVTIVVATTGADVPDSAETRRGSVVAVHRRGHRHPCRGAEADPYRPDYSDGDRDSTVANLCASEVRCH